MQAIGASTERLVLESSLGQLAKLAPWVAQVARNAGLADETTFALQLCLEEALANIVMYGGAPADAEITVQVTKTEGGAIAVIEDRAVAFDPTQVPPRTKPSSLHDARIGGVGVHLMRNYSSEMRYERRADCNWLTFRFDNAPASVD